MLFVYLKINFAKVKNGTLITQTGRIYTEYGRAES